MVKKKTSPKKITPSFKYEVEMRFNAEVFTAKSNDLSEAIMSLKPERLLTEVFIKIYKDKELISERRIDRTRGRRIFGNPESLEIFLMSLILTN